MSLEIAKRIAQLIPSDSIDEIKHILSPHSLEQRKFIISSHFSGSSLLFYAITHRSASAIKYFLDECRADPNSFGTEGCGKRTCLSKAVILNDKNIVEILLRRGAYINGISHCHETAVSTACFLNHVEMTKFLAENGANISYQNKNGNQTLIASLYDHETFKYLVLNGANINLVDLKGRTVLMHALMTRQKKIISFLLIQKDIDVRIKNYDDEDALNMAMHFCLDDIVQSIIRRGGYTEEEVIKAYELQSYICYFHRRYSKSNALWQKSLRLRNLPMDTPIFNDLLPKQESDNDINLFAEDHRQALLNMRALYGPRHVLTLKATVLALCFVNIHQNFLDIYEILSRNLRSLNAKEFAQIQLHIESVFRKYIHYFSEEPISLENVFKMLSDYTSLFITKHQQRMTSSIRNFCVIRLENFVNFFIEMIPILIRKYVCSIDIILEKITKFIQINFKNSTRRSLIQICWKSKQMSTFRIFLSCGADVNQTDENNETILHYLLDSKISCKRELIKLVIDAGFDFGRITSSKYCLPCRMKKEGFFYYPEECKTLQCLAANAFCQKIVSNGTDISSVFRTIIQAHMHYP